MRDFSWQYFLMTGDVDAYMLFKEMDRGKISSTDYDDDYFMEEDRTEPSM